MQIHKASDYLFKFFEHIIVFIEYSYHIMTTEVFLLSDRLLYQDNSAVPGNISVNASSPCNDKHGNRQDQKCCQCHPHINQKHHNKYTDQCCYGCDQLGQTLVQTHLQSVHIIGDTGKDLTVCSALKIIQWQSVDLL